MNDDANANSTPCLADAVVQALLAVVRERRPVDRPLLEELLRVSWALYPPPPRAKAAEGRAYERGWSSILEQFGVSKKALVQLGFADRKAFRLIELDGEPVSASFKRWQSALRRYAQSEQERLESHALEVPVEDEATLAAEGCFAASVNDYVVDSVPSVSGTAGRMRATFERVFREPAKRRSVAAIVRYRCLSEPRVAWKAVLAAAGIDHERQAGRLLNRFAREVVGPEIRSGMSSPATVAYVIEDLVEEFGDDARVRRQNR